MANGKKEYLSPLQSMDFYLVKYHSLCKKLKLENDVAQLQELLHRELEPSVVDILQVSNYDALVVTDIQKKIVWANNGFNEMTGYSRGFAKGKRPSFLQGENTSEETKMEIRTLLKKQQRFSRALSNYRKNGEEYLCHIDVIPLFNDKRVVTHFLAMEKELIAA
ncbi:MAG: PAS domain-containing protein [Bacteroidota bacterium]